MVSYPRTRPDCGKEPTVPDALEMQERNAHIFRRENVPARGYTYKDYLSWGEDIHCELIDGVPYMMAAPGEWHQWVTGGVYAQLRSWLAGKPCRAYIAPFDVRLFPASDESDKVVVQPDVLVVCDREKLSDGKACKGPPDFVVEVVSEGSVKKDFAIKRALYEKAGVREYWVIDEDEVYKYVLIDGKYHETAYKLSEELSVGVGALPGCAINFREVVKEALVKPEEA